MSVRKDVVERYMEGFRRLDHAMILSSLADDVVWDLPGVARIVGKEDFDKTIEGPDFEGGSALDVDRLVEEGDTVVAIGTGSVARKAGGRMEFVFSDVFTFTGNAISRLESYVIELA